MRQIYEGLLGEDSREKLNYIVNLGHYSFSNISGMPYFNDERGSNDYDQEDWLSVLAYATGNPAPPYQFRRINRNEDEHDPGVFLKRIHSQVLNSIRGGYPVIIAVQYRTINYEENISRFDHGHSAVIVGVQEELPDYDLGFLVKILDPALGYVYSAYIYEELSDRFNASIFDNDGVDTWSDGQLTVTNNSGLDVSSPYLRISAPNMSARNRWDWREDVDVFIDSLMIYESEN